MKSIKLKNNTFIDSSGIVHNREQLDQILENILGKVLWTNTSPNNDFSSQQITLNNSDYDVIEWFYRTDSAANLVFSVKTMKGYGTQFDFNSSVSSSRWTRRISRVSDTKYSASDCTNISNNTTVNSQCVPLLVIGYKTEYKK